MASSLIRGKHLLSPAGSGETTVLYDAAVYRRMGLSRKLALTSLSRSSTGLMLNWAAWTMPSFPDWSTPTTMAGVLLLSRWAPATTAWRCGFWPAGVAGSTTIT